MIMEDADIFANDLINEAKRFLEKVRKEKDVHGREAYLHAALLIAFAALEAHINSIVDDFSFRKDLTPLEKSILFEKELSLKEGEFKVTEGLKMYRLEDRIEFIVKKFSGKRLRKDERWWTKLKSGLHLRNKLTHPKGKELITEETAEDSIYAIISLLQVLYRAVYRRDYPLKRTGLDSSMNF